MTPVVEVAAGCVLMYVSSAVEPTDTGWSELSRIEVRADESTCDWIRIPLPAGVRLSASKLIIKQGDDVRRKVRSDTLEVEPRSLRDAGQAWVWLPDMLGGDVAFLDLERAWTRDGALDWFPLGANHADLVVSDASVANHGRVTDGQRGPWVGHAEPGDFVRLTAPGKDGDWTSPFAALVAPGRDPEIRRTLKILLPPGDPQISLHPGGGSRVETTLAMSFEAEERDRSILVPTGADRSHVQVATQPDDAATLTERDDGLVLTVLASEGPARVTVAWQQADAPTHGSPLPGETLEVLLDDGKIVTEPNGDWFVAGVGTSAIIPSRKHLVKALDRRWRNAALPEPGLPNELRGLEPGWDAAAALPLALHERIEPMDWGADPLFVRGLNKARKTGGMTPTETGVMAWLYATQARLDAEWALVRPAERGPAGNASPAGYEAVLVRVRVGEEERWIDPACAECAPFEIRPELTGASALGRGIDAAPEPVAGRWTAVVGPDWIRWELVGPPALELRRWLAPIPPEQRYAALAAKVGGTGAEMREVEGLDELGATIRVAVGIGDGVADSPLALPPADPDGTIWVPWIGTREVIWQDAALPTAKFKGTAIGYARVHDESGNTTEKLVLGSRLLGPEDLAGLDAALRPPDARPLDDHGDPGDPGQ